MGKWRSFLIGVDGVDGSGKSTLARYLAWQLGMPAIETDMFRYFEGEEPKIHHQELKGLLCRRLNRNKPVIVEGVLLLETLADIELNPDYLVYTEREGWPGAHILQDRFDDYARKLAPRNSADSVFGWAASEELS